MKTAKPIKDKKSYYLPIQDKTIEFLYDLIFADIVQILIDGQFKLKNSKDDDFKDVIRSFKIKYSDGKFTGKFNARISKYLEKMGAKFKNKAYYIDKSKLPPEIQQIITMTDIQFEQQYKNVLNQLSNIKVEDKIKTFSVKVDYETTLTDLDKQLYETLKSDVSVIPEITPRMMANIAEDYNNNLKLYIKDFADNEILNLRDLVNTNTFNGNRAESLIDIIKRRFLVTKNKAKFLARQETSLLVSSFREQRYQACGITSYKWSTSHDSRVRESHRELNGKSFTWDCPPIIDEKTGKKGNPGTDFGCRCVAVPIVEF